MLIATSQVITQRPDAVADRLVLLRLSPVIGQPTGVVVTARSEVVGPRRVGLCTAVKVGTTVVVADGLALTETVGVLAEPLVALVVPTLALTEVVAPVGGQLTGIAAVALVTHGRSTEVVVGSRRTVLTGVAPTLATGLTAGVAEAAGISAGVAEAVTVAGGRPARGRLVGEPALSPVADRVTVLLTLLVLSGLLVDRRRSIGVGVVVTTAGSGQTVLVVNIAAGGSRATVRPIARTVVPRTAS